MSFDFIPFLFLSDMSLCEPSANFAPAGMLAFHRTNFFMPLRSLRSYSSSNIFLWSLKNGNMITYDSGAFDLSDLSSLSLISRIALSTVCLSKGGVHSKQPYDERSE